MADGAIVVSGGRGVGGPEGFATIEALADALGVGHRQLKVVMQRGSLAGPGRAPNWSQNWSREVRDWPSRDNTVQVVAES